MQTDAVTDAIGYLDLFINKKLNIFSLILFCYNILFLFYSVIKLRGFPLILFRYKILLRMMIEPTEASTAHLVADRRINLIMIYMELYRATGLLHDKIIMRSNSAATKHNPPGQRLIFAR